MEVAGPLPHIAPVNGLPLLRLSKPRLTGTAHLVKDVVDRAGAAVLPRRSDFGAGFARPSVLGGLEEEVARVQTELPTQLRVLRLQQRDRGPRHHQHQPLKIMALRRRGPDQSLPTLLPTGSDLSRCNSRTMSTTPIRQSTPSTTEGRRLR